MSRASYRDAIQSTGVLSVLAEHDPHVAGTPPLGLDLPSSDIDILCYAPAPDQFTSLLWMAFQACANFRIWQWSGADRPVVATFVAEGWCFEIFGQARPVAEQAGWRHFLVEQRLLALGGQRFAATVMALRRGGLKTEPAFAAALKLRGNPYDALLELEHVDDGALADLIIKTRTFEAVRPLRPQGVPKDILRGSEPSAGRR